MTLPPGAVGMRGQTPLPIRQSTWQAAIDAGTTSTPSRELTDARQFVLKQFGAEDWNTLASQLDTSGDGQFTFADIQDNPELVLMQNLLAPATGETQPPTLSYDEAHEAMQAIRKVLNDLRSVEIDTNNPVIFSEEIKTVDPNAVASQLGNQSNALALWQYMSNPNVAGRATALGQQADVTTDRASAISLNDLVAVNLAEKKQAPVETGMASWYGPGLNGNYAANGEVFNQEALTAAHPSLPFGTQVRVTNMDTGQEVVVRINDRGPFAKDRIIDLSAGAARYIGLIDSGVAPVSLEIVPPRE